MKKIFTLIAVAAMAISANAQGTFGLIAESGAIKAGSQVTSVSNITMTYGDTGAADFADPAGDEKLKDLLGATGYTAGNGTNGNKDNGTIYYFEPTKDGVLTVGAVINKEKTILVKKNNYSGDDVAFTVADKDGNAVTVTGGQVADKVYGTIKLNVSAGVKYAVGLAGSKMGYYGFKYEVSDPAGINNVTVAEAENGAAYNLAGQKVADGFKGVVIKNGKKMIQK